MRKKTKKLLGVIALGLGAIVSGGILLLNTDKPTLTKKEDVIPTINNKEISDGDMFI